MATNQFPAPSNLIRLAPDLSLPSDLSSPAPYESITFDPSGSLTEALGLSGKHAIYGLTLIGLPTIEIVTVKLTVDGEVIWNDVGFTPVDDELSLWGRVSSAATDITIAPFGCNSSLSLEVETVADTSVILHFIARPIK